MPLYPDRAKFLHYIAYAYPLVLVMIGTTGQVALLTGALDRSGEGMIVLGLLGLGTIALSFLVQRRARHDFATLVSTIDNDPSQTQAGRIHKGMLIIVVTTVFLGGYAVFQIMRMEYGGAQHVRLWRPIADLYHSFGFWPAVLCVPLSGLLILLALAWRLRTSRMRAPVDRHRSGSPRSPRRPTGMQR